MKKAPRITLLIFLFLAFTMIYALSKETFPGDHFTHWLVLGGLGTIWILIYSRTKEKGVEETKIYRKSRYR